jgi:hypothetical protein
MPDSANSAASVPQPPASRSYLDTFASYEEYKQARLAELASRLASKLNRNSSAATAILEALFQVQEEADARRLRDLQCNYSALMYLLTEQQALIGKLLEELLRAGVITEPLLEKITSVYGDPQVLDPMYQGLYRRFASYFTRIWQTLALEANQLLERKDSDAPKEDVPTQ